MKHKPWMKFYCQDWLGDPHLRACSAAERGILIDLMSLAHSGTPYGYLTNGGRTLDVELLSKVLRLRVNSLQTRIQHLLEMGRLGITTDGVYFIPRMAQQATRDVLAKEYGKRGGNPTLKGTDKDTVKPRDKVEAETEAYTETEAEAEGNPQRPSMNWKLAPWLWNNMAIANNLPTISKMTDLRKKHYQTRVQQMPELWNMLTTELPLLDDFVHEGSWFGFDWIMKSETNLQKLAEGKYRKDTGPTVAEYQNSIIPSRADAEKGTTE